MIRNSCVICNNNKLIDIFIMKNYPISMNTVIHDINLDKYTDLNWIGCTICGCVQLKELIKTDILYSILQHGTYTTPIMSKHYDSLTTFINKNICKETDEIIEFGGGIGVLANKLLSYNNNIKYTIVDLIDNIPDIKNINICIGNCEDYIINSSNNSPPVVILSHVFEHLYQPRKFIENMLRQNVNEIFIAHPNMEKSLEINDLSFINIGHTFYCKESSVINMFKSYGYLCDAKEYFQDHSIFFKFVKRIAIPPIVVFNDTDNSINKLKNYFITRENRFKNIEISNNYKYFIAPSSHFGQLIYHYLPHSKNAMIGFLDSDITKINRRVYGTPLYTFPKHKIAEYKDETIAVIISAGIFTNEIKNELQLYHNKILFIEI